MDEIKENNASFEDNKIEISQEEYNKFKELEKNLITSKEKPFSIYDKVKIPVSVLNGVIIGGMILILCIVIISVML